MQIITDRAHNGLMTAMLELELLLLLPGSAAGDGSAGVGGGVSLVVLLVGALVSACSHATRLRSVTLCCLRCLLPAAGATLARLVAVLLLSLKYFRFCSDFACAYGTLACSRIAFHFISFPPATFFSVYSISIFILAAMNYASSAGSAVLFVN